MLSTSEIGSAASMQIKAAEDASEHVVKAHPELYHYTGAAGLRGIVETNSFRATHFADMNDAQEIHTLRVPLVDELKKRLILIVDQARLQNPLQDGVIRRRDAPQHLARV